MQLERDEFKIMDDGIWISKKALEECEQHYKQVAENCFDEKNELKTLFYIGKSDVYILCLLGRGTCLLLFLVMNAQDHYASVDNLFRVTYRLF